MIMSFLRKVTSKPWEHAGEMEGVHGDSTVGGSASRTGLFMFLAVASSFFGLFVISYYTRSRFPDWEMLTDPGILWVNTAVLVLASVALQIASNAAKRDAGSLVRNSLIMGAVLTVIFIVGQWMAWEKLTAAGYYARANPANAFFYLFTGLHAMHLVGGMWFLGRAGFRLNRAEDRSAVLQSVTLCATYWHYLLLVWLVLFTLLLKT
jgi:cytochrome c oxidase subunit 3